MVDYVPFPPVSHANEDGLLAMGGELDINTLVSAYAQGIFPWFTEEQPVLWWSPDPRLVLYPNKVKVSRSLKKTIKNQKFKIKINSNFRDVMRGCALRGDTTQPVAQDTWITDAMREAYDKLHSQGYAHSIEAWQEDKLVGGLYGVVLGKVFFGESMFSQVRDASKVALVALCQWLQTKQFHLIDCQVYSDHLASLGAHEISRDAFLETLSNIAINQASSDFASGFDQKRWFEDVLKAPPSDR